MGVCLGLAGAGHPGSLGDRGVWEEMEGAVSLATVGAGKGQVCGGV